MLAPVEIDLLLGLINGVAVFLLGSIRQKRWDYADVAPAGAVFLSSFGLQPPVFLLWYISHEVTRNMLPPEIQAQVKYLGFASFTSFLVVLVSIGGFYYKAWKRIPAATGPLPRPALSRGATIEVE